MFNADMVGKRFKEELKIHNFLLDHSKPELFVTSQWKWPPVVYVIYRIVAALFLYVWLARSGIERQYGLKWFVFLTNETYLLLTLSSVLMAVSALYTLAFSLRKRSSPELLTSTVKSTLPWYLKIQWCLYNVTVSMSLYVTIAYWTLVYNPSKGTDTIGFMIHGGNTIYMLIDFFITATPIRLLHAWHSAIVAIVYIIFNAIYQAAGGTNPDGKPYVYHVFDFYGNPGLVAVISVLTVFVVVPLVWLLVYGLYSLRMVLSEEWCPCGQGYKGYGDLDDAGQLMEEGNADNSAQQDKKGYENLDEQQPTGEK